MNEIKTPDQYRSAELRRDRLGFALAARLEGGLGEFPHDISERLRIARAQAVARRKMPVRELAPSLVRSGNAAALNQGGDESSLWSRLIGALPVLALAAGLLAIHIIQNDIRANELAEIDAALLTDDLPPAAYADPGFAQFVKWSGDHGR